MDLTDFRFSEILALGSSIRTEAQIASMQYFVVMIDYGRRGREAIVDPEITRREVISRVASGEYKNVALSMKSRILLSKISPPIF